MKSQSITFLCLIVLSALLPNDNHSSDQQGPTNRRANADPAETVPKPQYARSSRPRILRTGFPVAGHTHNDPFVQTAVWNPQNDRQWRRTRNGWQQIDVSDRPATQYMNIARPEPQVHPFPLTVLVLLGVIAAAAWSSDEWEWHRLMHGNDC